jgi:hypothetical protein
MISFFETFRISCGELVEYSSVRLKRAELPFLFGLRAVLILSQQPLYIKSAY